MFLNSLSDSLRGSSFPKKALNATFLQMDTVGGMRQLFLAPRLPLPQPHRHFLKKKHQQHQLVVEDGIDDVLPISSDRAFVKPGVVLKYYKSVGSIL